MPSLSASIFGFATGIAIADKIDVVTSTHAARLMKSRRRIGRPSFGYPRFAVPGECSESPTVPRNVTAAWTDAAAPPLLGGAALRKEPRADRDVTPAAVASWVWSRTATCVLGADGDKGRVEAAPCEPCVHLILMGAIHIRDTNGRSPPPRPNGRELPKAE